MLFRKTLISERDNYVYRFNDGTVSVIAEDDETEVWIKLLHSFDDNEVYNNFKNSRLNLEDWQKNAEMTTETSDPQKELLHEKVSRLRKEDQDLYRLYFVEGYSKDEIADMKDVSHNTITKKIMWITQTLIMMCKNEV